MTEKEKLYSIVKYIRSLGKLENENHLQFLMWYAYGLNLGVTRWELVELTWFAKAEGPWSPEVSEAYKVMISEEPIEI